MDLNWSLEELYHSFEGEAFKEDVKRLDEMILEIKAWADENTSDHSRQKEKLEEYLSLYSRLMLLYEKLAVFAGLTLSIDSQNELAVKYDGTLEQKMSALAATDTKISAWISSIDNLEAVVNQSELLKAHAFYLKEITEKQKYKLSEKEEALLARMKNTGSSAWVTYKNLLIATHKVTIEIDGETKELPLTEVLNMAYHKDKDIRKKAYLAEIDSYKKIEEGVAAALNAIKGEVLTVCKTRGYTSPLEMTLLNSRMDSGTLDAMFAAIKESLPVFRKYLKAKAKRLGYTNGLPFYELYAPVTENVQDFSYEEGKAFVEKNFRAFSAHLADFAQRAMDNKWIDVFPKSGKVGGAFCCGIHSLGESRIMLNYGSNLGDVITMAHELGHGFHNECMKNESILNIDCPMPLAETASTFCETIVKKAALSEASPEEALALLETEISDCTQVIVDIYSRFLFESALFKKREEGPLSVKEIKALMQSAQLEAYGDGLDADYLHPYMWTWKSHYYDADYNFYNFPYAFGLLFAKGLYAKYLEDKEAFPAQYEKLLAVTGKKTITDVLKEVNVDSHDINFWQGSLKIIEEDIEKFVSLDPKN